MTTAALKGLLERYRAGTITQEEWDTLRLTIADPDWREVIQDDMSLVFETVSIDAAWNVSRERQVLDRVFNRLTSKAEAPVRKIPYQLRWWIAAAIIVIGGIGSYVWTTHKKDSFPAIAVAKPSDISPGTNRAVLTVGDSQPIDLLNNKTGIAVGSSAITYNDGERIADAGQALLLATPRGGQYQAVLPDGTKVWLNAASSLRFLSKFSGDRREVEVNGEVYMEVAQNHRLPFVVKVGRTEIQVLGTSFNINSYPDEETQKTTLVSGSVKVLIAGRGRRFDQGVTLRPGQQALFTTTPRSDTGSVTVQFADIDKVIAWKNGLFNFNGLTFEEIMKQLERWYDIKIVYEHNKIPNRRLAGEMTRGVSLNGLLEYLGSIGLRYRLDGRNLIILP